MQLIEIDLSSQSYCKKKKKQTPTNQPTKSFRFFLYLCQNFSHSNGGKDREQHTGGKGSWEHIQPHSTEQNPKPLL